MNIGRDTLENQIKEWLDLGYIAPEDIPSIELYMDQVTTFMDKYLSKNKRTDEDKTLTKTMINNYTKNDLLPPPNKKRYSKEHIILLIYIYYFKNVVSINDIQVMLKPLIDNIYGSNKAPQGLEDIYASLYSLEKEQFKFTEESLIKTMELVERDDISKEDEYLKKLSFLSLLGYDIFLKKKLMENIIDDMAGDIKRAEEAEQNTKATKKEVKKETKKENKSKIEK